MTAPIAIAVDGRGHIIAMKLLAEFLPSVVDKASPNGVMEPTS
jgi:hypothetical protein